MHHIPEKRAAAEFQVLRPCLLLALALLGLMFLSPAFDVVHLLAACQPIWVHKQQVSPHRLLQGGAQYRHDRSASSPPQAGELAVVVQVRVGLSIAQGWL